MSDDLLPSDLWRCIAIKLDALSRIRFRAVCKSWMSLIPQTPWLMLAEAEQQEAVTVPPPRGFVSLGEEQINQIDFPDLHQARCVGSTGNWLITAHIDRTIRLINPFSKQQIHLPSQSAFEHTLHFNYFSLEHIQLWKVVLSSSPSNGHGHGRDCVAMAIHNYRQILALARLGDSKWTTLQICNPPIHWAVGLKDCVFYKGRFYAADAGGGLLVCDIEDGPTPPKATYICQGFEKWNHWKLHYLVEWLGELLLVIKFVDKLNGGVDYRTAKFLVYKFDFTQRKWDQLKSLGEHSLFLGSNTSVSLRASDYFGLVKRNCIYFTDDFTFGFPTKHKPSGRDMGVYNLGDNSITPHFRGVSTFLYTPPLWIIPN